MENNHTYTRSRHLVPHPIGLAVLAAVSLVSLPQAFAQDQTAAPAPGGVEQVVVTGSLIPQTQTQTSQPVQVITADEMKQRGFATVAEALQQASFSTGSVQGSQYSGGFTQGARTLSMFGLSPSYVKYLIDGLPMADYPALYNGTDIITDISGIPTELVDHIDILPGGQSSIYGSDAIAGVVNVIMKKKLDAPVVDARYGFTQDGGGTDKRIALANSFTLGSANFIVGGQYEKTDPIWGYQRNLTKSYFKDGTSPVVAERDYLVFGLFGATNGDTYYFEDPSGCANVAGQFGGTTHEYARPGRGSYCGTTETGEYTIANGDESTQGYLRVTDDLTEHVQLYGSVLMNHDVTKIGTGASFYGTDEDSTSPLYYYEDPNLGGDLMNTQHIFSPEEAGGLQNIMDKNTVNGYRANLGVTGNLGASAWTYDVGMLYTQQKLTEKTHLLFTDEVEAFFAPIYGAQQGYDANYGVYIYTPDYAQFYQPVTPAEYASFSGYATSYSRTEDSMVRGQLTDPSLFTLPGGDAGLALEAEGGDQGWDYSPDPRYLDGETWGYTAVAGSGHRSRYAGTAELRMPLLRLLTLTASGRYDDYRVEGQDVDKFTYNFGLEFRPIETVLLRGRYGTAFKAPTLSDEFQGTSGSYVEQTDYYQCETEGYVGANLSSCPQYNESTFQTTSGNTKLKPITAKVWDIGAVWSPMQALAISADFMHFDINNEVNLPSADQLMRTDAACEDGTYVITSPTCVAALADIDRTAAGVLVSISTPKVNLSQEIVNTFIASLDYKLETGAIGAFEFEAGWSDELKHVFQQYPGDAFDNDLTDPIQSQEFKSKINASVTWDIGDWSSTLFVNRYGHTPNYLATLPGGDGYDSPGAGTLAAWTLANLSVRYQITPGLQLSAIVNNVFNTMPPKDDSYPGVAGDYNPESYNEFDYNVFGRTYLFEVNYKIGK